MTGNVAQLNWKKLSVQTLSGAAVGGASMGAVLFALDRGGHDFADPSQMIALVTGMIYALLGLMVGFGAFAPRTGARYLNVEDADDLRDQRLVLGLSSAACVLIGLLFLVLAAISAADRTGPFSPEVAAVVVGICLIGLTALTRLTTRRVDELSRQVSLEASALALQGGFLVFGGWACLAHLGFTNWIEPLAFVSGMALLQLLAIFWVAARRGLMVPANDK